LPSDPCPPKRFLGLNCSAAGPPGPRPKWPRAWGFNPPSRAMPKSFLFGAEICRPSAPSKPPAKGPSLQSCGAKELPRAAAKYHRARVNSSVFVRGWGACAKSARPRPTPWLAANRPAATLGKTCPRKRPAPQSRPFFRALFFPASQFFFFRPPAGGSVWLKAAVGRPPKTECLGYRFPPPTKKIEPRTPTPCPVTSFFFRHTCNHTLAHFYGSRHRVLFFPKITKPVKRK